jgi:hypothetical protein
MRFQVQRHAAAFQAVGTPNRACDRRPAGRNKVQRLALYRTADPGSKWRQAPIVVRTLHRSPCVSATTSPCQYVLANEAHSILNDGY